MYHKNRYDSIIKQMFFEPDNDPLLMLRVFKPILLSAKIIMYILKKNWNAYLLVYTKHDSRSKNQDNRSSCLLSICAAPSYYNYLFLAKIVNLVCNTNNLKYIIRHLVKKEFSHSNLVNVLSKKDINNSLFVCWLVHLWIDEFYQYMKRYTIYLVQSSLILNSQNIQLKHWTNFYFLKIKICDLLILKFYGYRSTMWYNKIYYTQNAIRNKIDHKFVKMNRESSGMSYINYNNMFFAVKNAINKTTRVSSNKIFDIKQKGNQLSKKTYINTLKRLIKSNKNSFQSDLIKKINKNIKGWDRSCKILLYKKEYTRLNFLLYEYLWRWGIGRHARKSARWIKQRYWHKTNHGYYFYNTRSRMR